MKKILLTIQIISTFAGLASKYLLAIDNVWGWWVAVGMYLCVAIYNANIKLKIYTIVGISLTLLTAYGGYKWSNDLSGVRGFDYLVIFGTILFTIHLAISESNSKVKSSLWKIEIIGTAIFLASFLTLGFGYMQGWYLMFVGHAVNSYIYGKKKVPWYLALQIISAYIALVKVFELYNLQLPFPIFY